MKRSHLSEQISDQLFGLLNRALIADRERYSSIPLQRSVDFDAPLTHRWPPSIRRKQPGHLLAKLLRLRGYFVSMKLLEYFRSLATINGYRGTRRYGPNHDNDPQLATRFHAGTISSDSL